MKFSFRHVYFLTFLALQLQTSCAFQVLRQQSFTQVSSAIPTATSTTTSTVRYATLSPREKTSNGYALSTEEITDEVEKETARRSYIWFFPPLLATAAYNLYDETSRLFHKGLDWASGHTWVPADGGKYVAEVTKSALTGPVTFSVSILFGTLVGLTISTLNGRQTKLQNLFVSLHQEGQELRQLLEECPEDIRQDGFILLSRFMHRLDQTLRVPDKSTDAALRKSQELKELTRLFHQRGSEVNAIILAEIYASLGRIKGCRVELWSAYTNNFSVAHYVNMIVLASALLFIFLLETDNGAMQFLIDFQLSICWALLIGAYSLLAAVIIDLRGIPPQLSTRLDQEAVLDDLPIETNTLVKMMDRSKTIKKLK